MLFLFDVTSVLAIISLLGCHRQIAILKGGPRMKCLRSSGWNPTSAWLLLPDFCFPSGAWSGASEGHCVRQHICLALHTTITCFVLFLCFLLSHDALTSGLCYCSLLSCHSIPFLTTSSPALTCLIFFRCLTTQKPNSSTVSHVLCSGDFWLPFLTGQVSHTPLTKSL